MAISDSLNRRIRARPEEDEDTYSTSSTSDGIEHGLTFENDKNYSEGSTVNDKGDDDMNEDDEDEDEEDGEDDDLGGQDAVQSEFSQISFGALAKAQASLGKRKRSDLHANAISTAASSALEDIRSKIREAHEKKRSKSESKLKDRPVHTRSSKHAPAVQSSKHAVSRKRTVVEPPSVTKARDPRFDSALLSHSGTHHNPNIINNAYAFLDEYRASELKQLKEQMARTKDPAQKEELKRAIRSAMDRQKTLDNKKREREVIAEHKKHERQLIREGKKSQPYYLKNSDLKQGVLKKKYESMGLKERTKALERRRKKVASKEKRDMPWGRRTVGEKMTDGGGDQAQRGQGVR